MDSLLSWPHISKSNLKSNLFRLLSNHQSNCHYLGCQDVKVTSAVSPADEFTPVIGRHSRVLGYPHHRGGDTVTVETAATGLTLLLTVSLTYTEGREGRSRR